VATHLESRLSGVLAGLVLALAAVPPAALAQQALGTIRGEVRDERGAAALVTVSLAGTARSTVTDRDGRYEFGGVSEGVFTVRAERAGAAAGELREVRVRAGVAARADLWLARRSAAGALEEESASRTVLRRSQLDVLPFDDIRHALSVSPAVVLRGTDIGIAGSPSLAIRGSEADQIGVYVDGAPARFEAAGEAGIALGTDAISQVEVLTGVPSVAFADTRGGAVFYETRSGGSSFEHGLSAASETPFGSRTGVQYTRFEGFLGGPAPRVPGLTWFVSAAVHGQPSAYRGAGAENAPTYVLAGVDTVLEYGAPAGQTNSYSLPRFAQASGRCGETGNLNSEQGVAIRANYGYECTALRRPLDWATSARGLAKLRYAYGSGSSVSLTGLASDYQRRYFPGMDIGAAGLYSGLRTRSRLAVLNWEQNVGRVLALHANVSYGSDEYLSGPLEIGSGAATADPALGIELEALHFAGQDIVPFPVDDEYVRRLRTFSLPLAPYQGRTDLNPSQSFRANPYGLAWNWPTQGVGGQLTLVSEHRLSGRWLADWQASPEIRLMGGADMARTDVSFYSADLVGVLGLDAYRAKPQRLGFFASGLLERGDLAVDVGVRVDRFTPGAQFPVVPGRIFTNPGWSPGAPAGDTSYAAAVARVFTEGRTQLVVSPRVRMAFRVSRRTTTRIGVARQAEPPALGMLFRRLNSDLAFTSRDDGFGTDVDIVSSSFVEAGIRHAFSPDATLDVSAYDVTRLTPYAYMYQSMYDPFAGANASFLVLTPVEKRGTGVDARLEWRGGKALSGSVAYSLIRVSETWPSITAIEPVVPEGYSTHAVAGSISLSVPERVGPGPITGAVFGGVRADLLFRLTSGLPYTRYVNRGSGLVAPSPYVGASLWAERLNSSRLPWTSVLDLRLAKSIPWGAARLTAFVEARNLLGARNLLRAFAETGDAVNELFRENVTAGEAASLRTESAAAGALLPDGTIDLTGGCATWQRRVNCVALQRVENRFGDGDGLYSPDEQRHALDAFYDAFFGTWQFYGPGRTARAGMELRF